MGTARTFQALIALSRFPNKKKRMTFPIYPVYKGFAKFLISGPVRSGRPAIETFLDRLSINSDIYVCRSTLTLLRVAPSAVSKGWGGADLPPLGF